MAAAAMLLAAASNPVTTVTAPAALTRKALAGDGIWCDGKRLRLDDEPAALAGSTRRGG